MSDSVTTPTEPRTEAICQVDGCFQPHRWFTNPGLYLCDKHSRQVLASQPEPAVTEALREAWERVEPFIEVTSGLTEAQIAWGEWERALAAVPAPSPAPDPEADDSSCGCGAIGVAVHTNAEHYATSPAPAAEPDWCGLIGSFMGREQYCAEPASSPWHQPGESFKHDFVPLTLTPARAASPSPAVAPLDVERLASVMHDSTCTWRPHSGFTAKTDEEYHRTRATVLVGRIAAAYAEASEQAASPGEDR